MPKKGIGKKLNRFVKRLCGHKPASVIKVSHACDQRKASRQKFSRFCETKDRFILSKA
jgi:hypothetical protein